VASTRFGVSLPQEDFIARGDRRIGAVVKRAWELGATNDGWWAAAGPAGWLACGLGPSHQPSHELSPVSLVHPINTFQAFGSLCCLPRSRRWLDTKGCYAKWTQAIAGQAAGLHAAVMAAPAVDCRLACGPAQIPSWSCI
jgi:hypothetical protein